MDGLLIVDKAGLFLCGMGAALLLGNLAADTRPGSVWRSCSVGAGVVIYNDPTRTTGDLIFTPALFAIGWLVGFALRERTEQTEAAEERALGQRESGRRRLALRWPRSAQGSPESSTTSSRTPSA